MAESTKWPHQSTASNFLYSHWDEENKKQQEEEKRKLQNAVADQKALYALADHYLPSDVKENAARWKMEETLCEMWRNAFIAGWRAYHRSSLKDMNE